jgi:hypothetical protein
VKIRYLSNGQLILMHRFLLTLLIFFSVACQGQEADSTYEDDAAPDDATYDDDWRNTSSGNNIWKFEAGYTLFRPYRLNDYLAAQGSPTGFTSLQTLGTTFSGSLSVVGDLGVDGTYDGAYSLHFFLPQTAVVKQDSLQYQIGGWEFMTSLYGIDVFRRLSYFDFVLAPGFYLGTMRLHRITGHGDELFKNPFIAVMLRADMRFVFGPFAIGGRWSYRHDTSKSKWRKDSDGSLPGYRCRELQYMVYVGWTIHWGE